MILVDANLLIYAVNQDLPQHKQARAWWERMLSGTARMGIPWAFIKRSMATKPWMITSKASA